MRFSTSDIPSYPDQIMEATKVGFVFGMFCGLFSHPVNAICNLNKNGLKLKPLLNSCPQAALTNIPRLGVKFAAFTSIWTSLECAMDHYHGKVYNELHNAISLPATVALFKSRQGFRVASRSAIGWGSVYAIFGGSVELLNVYVERNYRYLDKGSFLYEYWESKCVDSSKYSFGFDNDYVPPISSDVPVPPFKKVYPDEGISIYNSMNMNRLKSRKKFRGHMIVEGLAGSLTNSNKEALEEDEDALEEDV